MGDPGWLTKIICSYLSQRSLSIHYKSETSLSKMMPGGTGAGTILGLECFLIIFNEAGPAANSASICDIITQPLTWRQPIEKCKVKLIDDMTVCAVVNSQTLVLLSNCQLTVAEKTHLNGVLRCGLHIIYGDTYRSFTHSLSRAGMLSVTDQLQNIKTRFAHKSAKHPKFSKWFKVRPEAAVDTRRIKIKYLPVATRPARYAASPIPYLTSLING